MKPRQNFKKGKFVIIKYDILVRKNFLLNLRKLKIASTQI